MKTKLLYVLLFIFSYTYAQFPSQGLVRGYDFTNGSTADLVGSEDLTLTTPASATASTMVNDRFNNPNNAVKLNGSLYQASNIDYGGVNFSNNANGNKDVYTTLSFWVKTSNTTSGKKTIIDESQRTSATSTGWYGYYVFLEDGEINVQVRSEYENLGSGSTYYNVAALQSSSLVADNTWKHVVVTIHGKQRYVGVTYYNDYITELFIDGTSEDDSIITQNHQYIVTTENHDEYNAKYTIGNIDNQSLQSTEVYTDEIDDLFMYNALLTQAEITVLYTSTAACIPPNSNILSASSVLGTSATIDISGSDTYDIAYHKTSEPFANAIITTGITTGSVNISTLDQCTSYDVYVRKHCGSTISEWSNAFSFGTGSTTLQVLHVDSNATGGANDGTSWANAYVNLQDALTIVGGCEQIWIAAGTYKPHASSRSTYFNISSQNVSIYGGFSGVETQVSDRVLGTNETILSGDLNENDSNVSDYLNNYNNTTRSADNSIHVINITATGNNLLLDGLTISDAHNSGNATERGGAIVKHKTVALLTLKNCIIKDNVSRNDNAGLVAEFDLNNISSVTGELNIENCKFINNMSRWASGIYSFARASTKVDINVTNTLFDGNVAGDLNTGSATGLSGSSSWFRGLASNSTINLSLTNNTYVNNSDIGTGQSLDNSSRATLGISRSGSSAFNATVANCIFWNNTTFGGTPTRSITDLYSSTINSLLVYNSLDALSFNDSSITNHSNTISSNPLFTSNTDFTLQSSSPAIDTGNNSYVTVTSDLLGNQRIFNTTVDMGVYEFGAPLLGIQDDKLLVNFILYPNPVRNTLNIQLENALEKVEIYSVLGRKVLENNTSDMNVSSLSPGMYLLKVYTVDGKIGVKRFVKK